MLFLAYTAAGQAGVTLPAPAAALPVKSSTTAETNYSKQPLVVLFGSGAPVVGGAGFLPLRGPWQPLLAPHEAVVDDLRIEHASGRVGRIAMSALQLQARSFDQGCLRPRECCLGGTCSSHSRSLTENTIACQHQPNTSNPRHGK